MEENPNAGKQLEDDDELDHIDYDADGNPIAPEKNKHIDPLPAIDHNEIKYEEFTKNFYEEHSDIRWHIFFLLSSFLIGVKSHALAVCIKAFSNNLCLCIA